MAAKPFRDIVLSDLRGVKQNEIEQFVEFITPLPGHNFFYIDGDGMSLAKGTIGLDELNSKTKTVEFMRPDTPLSKDIFQVFSEKSQIARKLNYICFSVSGGTDDPYYNLIGEDDYQGLIDFKTPKNTVSPVLSLVTSNKNSKIGNKVDESGGIIVEIKYDEDSRKDFGISYLERGGVMADVPESDAMFFAAISSKLAALAAAGKLKRNQIYDAYLANIETLDVILKNASLIESSEPGTPFNNLIEDINNPFEASRSEGNMISNIVSEMFVTRANHVRAFTSERKVPRPYEGAVFRADENRIKKDNVPMDNETFFLSVSKSGQRRAKRGLKKAYEAGVENTYIITGPNGNVENKVSEKLTLKYRHIMRIPEEYFYPVASFELTNALIEATKRMVLEGIYVNEDSFRKKHANNYI